MPARFLPCSFTLVVRRKASAVRGSGTRSSFFGKTEISECAQTHGVGSRNRTLVCLPS